MNAKNAQVVGLLFLLVAGSVFGQESAVIRQQMATNHLKQLAVEMSAGCLAETPTLEQWKRDRTQLRAQLLEMLGLDPLPRRTPLRAEVVGRLDRAEYFIEKIVFQSLPGLYVTGNFYVPKGATKRPAVLYLCGHSPHSSGAKVPYQDRPRWYAAHGIPCLVLDTLEFGEVAGIHHGTHNLNMWHWLSLGYTPAGVEVWNAMRALDYLETRPEVDASQVGLTGISGGGAITWYTAAVDERFAAAAPVCSTFTFGSQASQWLASGQCDCIYYVNTYGWDFPLVAALIAPRPLLILSGAKDTIFPPDGYYAVFQRAKKVYDLYAGGNSDRIREVDADVGHSDPPLFLREAREWMRRWLAGETSPLPEGGSPPAEESGEDLACLDRLPADAVNYRIHNEFTAVSPRGVPGSKAEWERRRADLTVQLKEKVFRWFPTNSVPFETQTSRSTGAYLPKYADYREFTFRTEPGVRIRAQLIQPRNATGDEPLLIYAKRAGDSLYFMDIDELLPLFGRHTVLVLNPRFTELPLSPSEHADVERTAAWVGRTIASMQIWDILRAARWAREEGKLASGMVSLYGKGDMAVVALYAALLDPTIQRVIVNDPPSSHWQRPALLNVLRVTDVSEVAAALAPRRLLFLTPPPATFSDTRLVYDLLGASAQLAQSGSLPEALEVWLQPRR